MTIGQYTKINLKPRQSIRDWVAINGRYRVESTGTFWDGTSVVAGSTPFNPRRRLTGLALRLLAVSNAWKQT